MYIYLNKLDWVFLPATYDMANYNRDWRRKRVQTAAFVGKFEHGEEDITESQETEAQEFGDTQDEPDLGGTQEEAGTSQNLGGSQEEAGAPSHFSQFADETSFDEPDILDDNPYSQYPDSSDEDIALVDLQSESEEEEPTSLRQDLAVWAKETRQTHLSGNQLLAILRKHGHNLPKDYRTLMETPRVVDSKKKCNGEYIYYGLKSGIRDYLEECPSLTGAVMLDINIDGLPIFKSSQKQLWPILAKFHESEPFIVALFCGNGKPDPVEDYLLDFIEELVDLQQNGIVHKGNQFAVNINAFICDSPARAFVKCIKGHNAYQACERCNAMAIRVQNRMVYSDHTPCEARTDERFQNLEYGVHQKSATPLIAAGVGCVTQFALDYMHVVCLGAVKRLLKFLLHGPPGKKMSTSDRDKLSGKLISLRGQLPSEFARQPRSLDEIERWKATEFRQFLLYTGPVVLRDVVSTKQYEHFLCLSIGISILLESDQDKREAYLEYAKSLLKHFVENSAEFYGDTFCVYTIHTLLHLHEDVSHFHCSLNNISAFPFENHLQSIKRMVRCGNNPIAQVTKRLAEGPARPTKKSSSKRYYVSEKPRDRCFLIEDGLAFVRERRSDGKLLADVITFDDARDLFSKPCKSKTINIAYVDGRMDLARRRLLEKRDLLRKAVCIPHSEGFAIFPLLHTMD